jgi:5-methylcytosine-specific restriction endonuclease McrA
MKAGLLTNNCQSCGLSEWLGKPLNMHLDHVNGVNDDNRLENLRMLCPNCHSQTPTYSGRNIKPRPLQEPAPVM